MAALDPYTIMHGPIPFGLESDSASLALLSQEGTRPCCCDGEGEEGSSARCLIPAT